MIQNTFKLNSLTDMETNMDIMFDEICETYVA